MASLAVPSSRGADISKGVVSLLGLVALVVVVPVLLVGFVGWPLPHAVPSVDAVTTALGDRYVPDRFLVGAIAIVCWIVWTELVASVVVEVIALARGRSADQVPFAAGAQKAAARLVAGVALLAALAASRGHEPAVRALTPASASPVVAGSFIDDAAAEAVAEAPSAAPTHTVVPRDTLWDISEACLSDPRRWTEIWELNKGRAMGDGRTFTDPDRIHPGWVLTLPADAAVGAGHERPGPRGHPRRRRQRAPGPRAGGGFRRARRGAPARRGRVGGSRAGRGPAPDRRARAGGGGRTDPTLRERPSTTDEHPPPRHRGPHAGPPVRPHVQDPAPAPVVPRARWASC